MSHVLSRVRLSCAAACLPQQKFHKITQAYYRGSHGIVLVYDISDPETLDNTAYWMKSIRDTAGSNRVQICLVGNKVRFPHPCPPLLCFDFVTGHPSAV